MMNYKTITLTLGVVATANAIRITSLAEAEKEIKDFWDDPIWSDPTWDDFYSDRDGCTVCISAYHIPYDEEPFPEQFEGGMLA